MVVDIGHLSSLDLLFGVLEDLIQTFLDLAAALIEKGAHLIIVFSHFQPLDVLPFFCHQRHVNIAVIPSERFLLQAAGKLGIISAQSMVLLLA